MNNLSRDVTNGDGTIDTVLISSNDNYSVNLDRKYKLANHISNKNSFGNTFRNSILGSDIGYKSRGFASIAVLSSVIATVSVITLFFIFRI